MSKVVFLRLGQGSLQSGFSGVEMRLEDSDSLIAQKSGYLPAAADLAHCLMEWQFLYEAFYDQQRYRLRGNEVKTVESAQAASEGAEVIEFEETGITGFSEQEFRAIAQAVKSQMQSWLNTPGMLEINNLLRTRLQEDEAIRVIIETHDRRLQQLPWHCWQFFEDYRQAEPSFSAPNFEQHSERSRRHKPRILIVLGNREGIDSTEEEDLLRQLQAETTFLVEPSLKNLTEALRHPKGWDIFFFTGHSSSQVEGQFFLNATDTVTVDDLRYAMITAISHGLKLAIFNSCDGSKLAQDLQALNIPTAIVMKESVPNQVAQDFLRSFLQAFATGSSVYSAVRSARECLQGSEREFPCASWLPGIWQNPAVAPFRWNHHKVVPLPPPSSWQTVLITSLMVAGLVIGVRSLGWLNAPELWAYDRLMQWQRPLPLDPRILLVTVTDDDVKTFDKPLKDETVHRLLTTLRRYQPRVIGLDIYRDIPLQPGTAKLLQLLQKDPHIISVCSMGEKIPSTVVASPQPTGVPANQLGFVDALITDDDDFVRRYSLAMPQRDQDCPTDESLALRVVRRYLPTTTSFNLSENLSIDATKISTLKPGVAGYQQIDHIGFASQVLIRFNRSQKIAEEVSLTQVLNKPYSQFIRDRIILIGYVGDPMDTHSTPVGTMAGVRIHAHVVSQLLNAVTGDLSFIAPWSALIEFIWVSSWGMIGGFLSWRFRSLRLFVFAQSIALSVLLISCSILLFQSVWVPITPAILALLTAAQVGRMMQSRSRYLNLKLWFGNSKINRS